GHKNELADYSSFRIWLVRSRLGEHAAATEELQNYLKQRQSADSTNWCSKVAYFLSGQLDEAQLFNAAQADDEILESNQRCEAFFYAGSKHLFAGDGELARKYFERCLETGVDRFSEYQSASAELRFMNEPGEGGHLIKRSDGP